MKNPQPQTRAALNQNEQAVIQSLANTLGELTNRAVATWLTGIVSLLKTNRLQSIAIHPSPDQADEFLMASDIAKLLKISKALAYRMIQTKVIPSFSIGRTVRIRRVIWLTLFKHTWCAQPRTKRENGSQKNILNGSVTYVL